MTQHFRIFLSSPGDVSDERALAIKVIDELQHEPSLKDRVTLEAVAWDKPGAPPMEAGLTPQEAINAGLSKPSACDVVVVIFWSRMGTPLEFEGVSYLSGTHYEYEEAMAANRNGGNPRVLVYWRTAEVVIPPDDTKHDEKQLQYQRVKDFFAGFTDSATGHIRGGYNTYKTPQEFAAALKGHLLNLLKKLAEIYLHDEIDSLLEEFQDETTKDYRLRVIIERCGEIGEAALPALIAAFRTYIIEHDGLIGDLGINFDEAFKTVPNAVSSLISASNDSNADVRFYVTKSLGELMDVGAVNTLIQRLDDRQDYVRRIAAESLGQLNDATAIVPLIECLNDPSSNVRRAAAEALGQLNDLAAVMPLIDRLTDADSGIRLAATNALRKLSDRAAVNPLIGRLRDDDNRVRYAAIATLVNWNDTRAVEPLIKLLADADDDTDIRVAAAVALGKLKDSRAIDPLIKCLDDREVDVQEYAAIALVALGNTSGTANLIHILFTEAIYVTSRADEILDALRKIGTPEALYAIEEWKRRQEIS